MRRFLVIGFGSFGSWFSRTMLEMGHEVVVIERDGDLVDRLAHWATRAIEGDGTERMVLERAGAADVDAAVISTGEDLAATILSTLALRDLGVQEIFAKVRSTRAARALDALGVTEAIFPEREAAGRLAHRIVSRSVLEYVPICEGMSLQEVAVPPGWIGRTLLDIAPREKLGLHVVAVRDALTGAVAVPPDPAVRLTDSESLLIAGPDEAISKLLPARER